MRASSTSMRSTSTSSPLKTLATTWRGLQRHNGLRRDGAALLKTSTNTKRKVNMVKGYVDCVVLALMPEVKSGLAAAVGGPLADGYATEQYLEKMDEAGIEISI